MNLACDWLWCRRQFSGPITISLKTPLFRSCWSWQYTGRFLQINLVQVPKTSKMAMIRLQVESSENPIFLHQTPVTYVSDLFFLMWIFEKKNFKCTLNITTDLAYSTKRKVKRWDKKRKRKSCLTPASERIVPTEGPDLDVHPQL